VKIEFANQSKKFKKRASIIVFVCLLIVLTVCYAFSSGFFTSERFGNSVNGFDESQDFVKIIDVGQGDSILIYSNGYSALIDTGLEEAGLDVCLELEKCGIEKLDVLLLTHLDSDHTGSIASIISNFGVSNLILPELSVESEGITRAELAINAITQSKGNVFTAVSGMNFRIGEFEFTILASFPNMPDENNRSVISVAEIDGKKFLFTGDMEAKAEKALLSEGLNLKCDVLKVGHHGSSTSSSKSFLNKVKPKYAAISVGADNMYGHPHREVLAAFENIDAKVYRTDINGDITFFVEDGIISCRCEK